MAGTDGFSVGQLRVWLHEAPSPRARVLLVHGLGEHSGRHASTAAHLVGKGFEVVRFDQRGCGQSGGDKQWIESFDDYAQDVRAVMDWAKASRPALPLFLMGHSLGGAVAVHAAAAAKKGELRGLILTAPAFLPGGGVSPLKIAVGKMLEKLTPRLRIPGSLDVTAISRDPAVVAAYQADPLNCSFNTVRQGGEILRALDRIPELCKRIDVPVLIAHGDADRLVKVEGSKQMIRAIASADKTLELFPGAFHELHNDTIKDEFYAKLDAWLARRL